MAQISLIPLQEWIECPLRPTVTTLPAPVTMTPGDELILTPAGSTFNGAPSFNGRLPNAAELAGAPYYHVLVRAYAGGSGLDYEDRILVSADGEAYARQSGIEGFVYAPGTLYTYVPAATESLSFLAGTLPNTDPTNLVVSFYVPQYPVNTNGEGLSLEQILRWQNAPLRPFAQDVLTLTPGNPPTPLAIPSVAERGAAPWGYLSVSYEAADPFLPSWVAYYANGEAVPFTVEDSTDTGFNTVYAPAPALPVYAKPTDWSRRFSWDNQIALEAFDQVVTARYTWLVPDVPEVA